MRRDPGASNQDCLTCLAQALGIETPTTPTWRGSIGSAHGKAATPSDGTRHDPDPLIKKRKDGRPHLAHKAEHAVGLETGAVVGVTMGTPIKAT